MRIAIPGPARARLDSFLFATVSVDPRHLATLLRPWLSETRGSFTICREPSIMLFTTGCPHALVTPPQNVYALCACDSHWSAFNV